MELPLKADKVKGHPPPSWLPGFLRRFIEYLNKRGNKGNDAYKA